MLSDSMASIALAEGTQQLVCIQWCYREIGLVVTLAEVVREQDTLSLPVNVWTLMNIV